MRRFEPPLLLLGAVAAAYGNSFSGVFQFDDYNVLVDNPAVHAWSAFLADLPRGIRPVLKLTCTLNFTFGLGLPGFHLVNAALHGGNALLVYLIAVRLFGSVGARVPALFAALLFALHPVQTEAVTYISGRSASLMSLFYLGSVAAYLRGRDERNRLLLHGISPALFLLAALSKETALTLPFALALCEAVHIGRAGWREAARAQAVHWALLAGLAVFVLAHPGYGPLLEYSFDIRSAPANLLVQMRGIAWLASGLFLLRSPNIDPDLPAVAEWSPIAVLTALLLAGALFAGVRGLRKGSPAGFGVLWFLLHLVPTNSFVPRLDVANDRQLYLASWGLFLALAHGAGALRKRWGERHVFAAAAALAVALLALTAVRNRDYRSETALWEDTARKSPGKARVRNNLGYAYEQAGRLPEAEAEYLRALSIDPGHTRARANLRRVLRKRTPGPDRPEAEKKIRGGNGSGGSPHRMEKKGDASMSHTLPSLPYSYDALEPHIDARTMEIHHGKHHNGYVTNLNKALEGHPDLMKLPVEKLLAQIGTLPEGIRTAVRNNGGGHLNHSLFWKVMKKGGGGEPTGDLAGAIRSAFGSFAEFRAKFTQAAMTRFGSGWAWLSVRGGKLVVESSANQDNPILEGGRAVFGLDVWEHAYYLKYQNRRAEYVEAWWNTIDWKQVAGNYEQAKK